MNERDDLYYEFIDAMNPEIYYVNPFRILGVSVEDKLSEIKLHVEKLTMMKKFGLQGEMQNALAVQPEPDEYAIREAFNKLRNPIDRLIAEFFWFWPQIEGNSKGDKALLLLKQGDIPGAESHWLEMEESSSAYVSKHNLAVLYHCLALDLEQMSTKRALSEEEKNKKDIYWYKAINRWKLVFNHEPFWRRLAERIRRFSDPRLTTGLARKIRASLPFAIFKINTLIAIRLAEEGNWDRAKRQVEIIESGLSGTFDGYRSDNSSSNYSVDSSTSMKKTIIRYTCKHIRERVSFISNHMLEIVEKEPLLGVEKCKDLITRTVPLIEVLNFLLGRNDATVNGARDEVANAALSCLVIYGNNTGNWEGLPDILKEIEDLAVGSTTRNRIKDNLRTIENNLVYKICWFCNENPPEDSAAVEIKMYGDVERIPTFEGIVVQWHSNTIKVPRCSRCLELHREHSKKGERIFLFVVVGAVIGITSCVAMGGSWYGIFSFMTCTFLSYILGKISAKKVPLPPGIKPEGEKIKFPDVVRLIDLGWKFGEKPSDVS